MPADLWVQVETGLPASKLVDRLCVDLDIDTHEAVGYLVLLWLAVMEIGCGGDLRERSDQWIERVVGWRGMKGRFAASLRQHHLIDGVIRDWRDKYGHLEATRAEAARHKRNQRSRSRTVDTPVDRPPERPVDSRADSPVDDVVDSPPVVQRTQGGLLSSSSSSSLVSALSEPEQQQKPVGKESPGTPADGDVVAAFVGEFDFGPFAPVVTGFLRAQRRIAAVMAMLRMHREGEMGHEKATGRELGLAIQNYSASTDGVFNAKLFRAYVRDAKQSRTVGENRTRNTTEQQAIDREQAAKAASDREVQASDALLAEFAAANPSRYAELTRIAEDQVPRKLTLGRELMVRAKLLTLVREEVVHASQ